jgi:hypothetical protein
MFDSKTEIELSMDNGQRKVVVRWPTDAEWIDRTRLRKFTIRRLGRGVSENVPPEPIESDVKLYNAIALNGAPPVTPAEAGFLLDQMGQAQVTGVRVEGDDAIVEVQILTGEAIHRMRLPKADQVQQFRRASFRLFDLPYGQQQFQLNPDAGGRLYDACNGSSEDYVGAVPVIHKDVVARNVVDFIEREMGPRPHENF